MTRSLLAFVFVATTLVLAGPARAQLSAVRIASGLESPAYLAAPPGDERLFILELRGRILVWQNGSVLGTPFLDLTSEVFAVFEGGLLGMVFAPDYATSGVFWAYYTRNDGIGPSNMASVVSRFTVNGDPTTSNVADPLSEEVIFEVHQPAQNHNGGTIAIRDGFLYLALGDGGGSSDTAQSDQTLLGKMIRLDLDLAYAAADNEDWEVYAKGLRNPFRFSFDRATGDLYIGDVGAAALEEVNAVAADEPAGLNFGWNVMEGTNCFDPGDPGEPPCNSDLFTDPIFTFPNPSSGGACVTGGAVYRGSDSGSLRGTYFFGDGCANGGDPNLYSLRWTPEGGMTDLEDLTNVVVPDVGSINRPVAVVEGGDGEIYIVDLGSDTITNGEVFRLVPEPGSIGVGASAILAIAALRRVRRRTE
ncbi:MAG: PQQ-dependent sugar dehydrogenase [Myxococcota bacterium]|nr:PQQ-dependent sugar dehydrogenase [Myxococcota bacterium]